MLGQLRNLDRRVRLHLVIALNLLKWRLVTVTVTLPELFLELITNALDLLVEGLRLSSAPERRIPIHHSHLTHHGALARGCMNAPLQDVGRGTGCLLQPLEMKLGH